MDMDIDSLVTFMIAWGIPASMVSWGYYKMDRADRKSAMDDFTSLRFILTIGSIVLGAFVIHLGSLLSIPLLKMLGLALFVSGGICSVIMTWPTSKIRSLLIIALVCLTIYLNLG